MGASGGLLAFRHSLFRRNDQEHRFTAFDRENTLVGAEFISALRAHVKCAPTFLYAFGVFIMGAAGTQVMSI